MASTINAKTTGVGGIDASGDASGVLALQTGGTTAVTIDASQNVVLAKGLTVGATAAPAFSAYQSTLQSVANGTWTKVQFQTKEFDTNNNFDATTNFRFTPTISGYYQVSGSVQTQSSVNTAVLRCSIYKNGSSFKNGVQVQETTSTKLTSSVVSALIYFNGSTDYVELYVFQDNGLAANTQNTADSTYFQAFLARSA